MTDTTKNKDTSKQVVETYIHRMWDNRDFKAIDELVHEKCIIHSLLGDYRGPQAMKFVVQSWSKAFPDLVVENKAIISENDLVVVQWSAHGTHQGEFKGIKPRGKAAAYAGVTIYRINQGKIVEYWAYIDMQHLLNQLQAP